MNESFHDDFDDEAHLDRLLAETEAGLARIPERTEGVILAAADAAEMEELGVASAPDLARLMSGAAFTGNEAADTLDPGPVLAAVARTAADGPALAAMSENELLGLVGAGARLASWAAWIQTSAQAEFAARQLEPDHRSGQLVIGEFACQELAPVLNVTGKTADELLYRAQAAASRLPCSLALLRQGKVSELGLKIIAQVTSGLSDGAAQAADARIAEQAAGLTPGRLRALCTRTVMRIDAKAIERNRKQAAKTAKVQFFQEYSGNGAVSGRELSVAEVLACKQHLTAKAKQMRRAGFAGTLDQLRAAAMTALLQERDPLLGHVAPYPAEQDPRDTADDPDAESYDPWASSDESQDNRDEDDGEQPGEPGDGGTGPAPEGPQAPGGSGAGPAATINVLVPVGTLLGWSDVPAEVTGFGYLDPDTAREMVAAASANPATRWCVTVIDDNDHTATAHGCARGQHSWVPGPDPPQASSPRQVREFLRGLNVRLSPIAKGECDHRHRVDAYKIPRKLKHLIHARNARCTFKGCNNPAADGDADHTEPWPEGPSCECNLGGPCRTHHRTKQAPGWRLEQPEPGVMVWHTPSGRTYVTTPTRYDI